MILEISLYFKNSFDWREVFFFEYMGKKSFVFLWFLMGGGYFFYTVEHVWFYAQGCVCIFGPLFVVKCVFFVCRFYTVAW